LIWQAACRRFCLTKRVSGVQSGLQFRQVQ
jgi:hypothetical protein